MRRRPTLALLLAAGLLLASGGPLAADWLVMKDGTRVETEGPWEQRGGLLVFSLPGGALSSLRASAVDLEASEAATEEAARPPEPEPQEPPPPKAKAKYVFTEKELPPVSRILPDGSPQDEGAAAPSSGETPAAGDERLKVVEWNVVTPDDFDGSQVVGQIRNVGGELLTSVSLVVHGFNASGTPIGRVAADIPAGALPPDRIVDFTAQFPEVYGITAIKFDLRAGGFLQDSGESTSDEAPASEAPDAGSAADAAAAAPATTE